jgi:hypothetical protein
MYLAPTARIRPGPFFCVAQCTIAGLMNTKPFGVAFAAALFDARGHDHDAEAGGRGAYGNECEDYPVHAPGLYGCGQGSVAPVQHWQKFHKLAPVFCSAILRRRSKVRFEGLGDLSLGLFECGS